MTRRVLCALGVSTVLVIGLGACDSSTTHQAVGVALSSAPASPSPATDETAAPATWTMPNLIGANLQGAQDRIQSLTNYAIAIMRLAPAATRSSTETGRFVHRTLPPAARSIERHESISARSNSRSAA